MRKQHDFDSPWKNILKEYFHQFLSFFFPDVAAEIDWDKGYVPLDKELRKITREATIGARLADVLFKVWQRNGDETWVLVHIEVQAQEQENFPHRIYTYNYRIHDLYQRPAASLVILADENPAWRPCNYVQELWGCCTEFRFPVVKLKDYTDHLPVLEESNNPFAIVVLAHLRTLETKKDDARRLHWKVSLSKELYRWGFTKTEILDLYRFIDWIMVLPEELEETCYQEILQFEEESNMHYITTAERIGIKKGREEGIKEGIEKGKKEGIEKGRVIGEILLAQRILKLTIYSVEELEGKSLDELKSLAEQLEAKLNPLEDPHA